MEVPEGGGLIFKGSRDGAPQVRYVGGTLLGYSNGSLLGSRPGLNTEFCDRIIVGLVLRGHM